MKTPAQKAFSVLKKNISLYDMKDLIELLEGYVEEEVQKAMAETL